MPIDWDNLDAMLRGAVERGEQRTDEALASRISSLTRLTDDEIATLFPTPTDVEKLGRLLKIVKGAESRNVKVARLTNDIHELGSSVVTLLEKLV